MQLLSSESFHWFLSGIPKTSAMPLTIRHFCHFPASGFSAFANFILPKITKFRLTASNLFEVCPHQNLIIREYYFPSVLTERLSVSMLYFRNITHNFRIY